MILVLTSLLFLLGGTDGQSYTCRICGAFTNTTVPGGDQPTNGFYIVDMVRDANDCNVAVFKCVVFDPRCVATSYVNDASGNRLMTYPASNTTSEGGNMTCTVLSTGAGWRYNGVGYTESCGVGRFSNVPLEPIVASFRCNFNCESDAGSGAGDVTFADETVEPTTPTTTAQPTTPTTTTTVKPTTTTVKPTTTTVKPTTATVKPAATTVKPTTKKDNCKSNYGGGNIYVGSVRRGYY